VAEGILYPFMLDLFVLACEPLGIELNYAVLRAPLPVVLARVQSRVTEPQHAGALADGEVVGALWAIFEKQGLDSGERPPQAIADEIYQRWMDGSLRL
jgi:hypothetical protein